MSDTQSTSDITPANLEARGYRVYPGNFGERRFFQKRFDDVRGKRYFIEFREWDHSGITYDCRICCETDTGGYLWATFKENSIEQSETRAEAMWRAAGSIYYEVERSEITCSKCGVSAFAFQCDMPGCPVNGGMAYG